MGYSRRDAEDSVFAAPAARAGYAGYKPQPAPFNQQVVVHSPYDGQSDPTAAAVDLQVQLFNAQVRREFTRKVLLIVTFQLLVTVGVASLFFFVDPIKAYVTGNLWLLIIAFIVAAGALIAMACSTRARRKFPVNYVFLLLFTFAMAVVVGAITAYYDVDTVGIALAVTAATVFGAFCVATFTKLDLTNKGGFLLACLFGVIVASLIGIFFQNTWYTFVVSGLSAILFTAYLIYDLQLIMGGHRIAISPDEYIFASINIYLDIVNIFLNVLQMVGILSD